MFTLIQELGWWSLLYFAYILLFVLYRIGASLCVYYDAKSREDSIANIWGVLTFLFGMVSVIIFLVLRKKNTEKDAYAFKKFKSSIVFLVFVFVLVLVYAFGVYPKASSYLKSLESSDFKYSGSDVVYYEADGENVAYDKMGNAYTYENYYDDFKYYTKDGLTYGRYCDEDDESIDNAGYICYETNQKYSDGHFDYDFFIGEDGYLYVYEGGTQCEEWNIYSPDEDEMNDFIFYTKDGMIMYSVEDCSWDKNGNLVLNNDFKYKDLKFSDIPEDDKYWIYEND